tara:strand:+ start:12 stop:449 length:438 start_codon:yes stop_codon:yes gene_type:complete
MDSKNKLNLDGSLWTIRTDNADHIPAVELDVTTGNRGVLLFTSKEAAERFCWLRNPDAASKVYELTRRYRDDGSVLQQSLLKMCRKLVVDYPDLNHFVINHPGNKGHASYISVHDMVGYLSFAKSADDVESPDDFSSLLESATQD